MKKHYIILLVLLLTGCASVTTVQRNYQNINSLDGISKYEAKIIAKHRLIEHGNQYRFWSPVVYHSTEIEMSAKKAQRLLMTENLSEGFQPKYQDAWYVRFLPRKNVAFVPIFRGNYYFVVISDQSGEVLYEHDDNELYNFMQRVSE